MDSLQAELIVSPPAPPPKKSPPLAFAPTSNDSLAPLTSPLRPHLHHDPLASPSLLRSTMGLMSPQAPGGEQDLQVIVDQQANAIQLLHEAFAAERQVWALEKERLYQRIHGLEQLLKTRDHHSPAKSPILSPLSGGSGSSHMLSPQTRAVSCASRLPIIAEDGNFQPLSARREGAPSSIDLPGRPPMPRPIPMSSAAVHGGSNITYDGDIQVEEIPISPPSTAKHLSPLPPINRAHAGHTPLKAPRPPTPPPADMLLDGIEDTPTRNNTHINAYLTRSNDESDIPLIGPLSMPELPSHPDEGNFTLEALSKRLEQVAKDPEQCRPTVFAQPSPGMVSPVNEPATKEPVKDGSSQAMSLSVSAAVSPNSAPPPPTASEEFNGVRLKKKTSVNFGAPFGQLGPLGGRKMS